MSAFATQEDIEKLRNEMRAELRKELREEHRYLESDIKFSIWMTILTTLIFLCGVGGLLYGFYGLIRPG
jgi:hypothetical protein